MCEKPYVKHAREIPNTEEFPSTICNNKQQVVYSNNFMDFNKLQAHGFQQVSSLSKFFKIKSSSSLQGKDEERQLEQDKSNQVRARRVFPKTLLSFFGIPLISFFFFFVIKILCCQQACIKIQTLCNQGSILIQSSISYSIIVFIFMF